tara:strand:- start:519 stop:749 length:231 start_codon:yes stop_codon:yes gene_type:complete
MTFFFSSLSTRSFNTFAVVEELKESFRMFVISLFMEVLFDLALRFIFLCNPAGNRKTNFTCSASGIDIPLLFLVHQ